MSLEGFYQFSGTEELLEVLPLAAVYFAVLGGAYAISMLVQVARYVFYSLGLYTMARRRGLNHPWLAWIVLGSDWILGSIADQYQYRSEGKITNKRKILLGLRLGIVIASVVLSVMLLVLMIQGAGVVPQVEELMLPLIGMMLVLLAIAVMSVVLTVFIHISRYHLYQSCDPRNGVAYMVLGLLFPALDAIFLFVCRNKDGGMTAKEQELSVEPAAESVEAEPVIPAEPVLESTEIEMESEIQAKTSEE